MGEPEDWKWWQVLVIFIALVYMGEVIREIWIKVFG